MRWPARRHELVKVRRDADLHVRDLVALVAEARPRLRLLRRDLEEDDDVRRREARVRRLAPIQIVDALLGGREGDARERVAVADHIHAALQQILDGPRRLPAVRREHEVHGAVVELDLLPQVFVDELADARRPVREVDQRRLAAALPQPLGEELTLCGLARAVDPLEDDEGAAGLHGCYGRHGQEALENRLGCAFSSLTAARGQKCDLYSAHAAQI